MNADNDHGFTRGTARLAAGSISYRVAGAGPDVLWLHGAASAGIRGVALRMQERFRVWAPILPGYDGTPFVPGVQTLPDLAQLLAGFIGEVIGDSCEVVGYSMGARLATWLAILHPEKVDRLVLMAPAGFRPHDAPPLVFEGEAFIRQMYAHPERRSADLMAPEIRASDRVARHHYGIGEPRDEALLARLGEIRAATLILGGSRDERVPAAALQTVKGGITKSQLVYVYDAAHALEIDQPERVAALIGDFFIRGDAFIVNPGRAPAAVVSV